MNVRDLGGHSGCKILLCEKEDNQAFVRKISGNIDAKTVFIDGEVSGEIVADKVEIGEKGRVTANISSTIFVIQEGGLFEGNKKLKKEVIQTVYENDTEE